MSAVKDAAKGAASRAKFRDTLWFKKGEVDAINAHAAAVAAAEGRAPELDRADSLPIEDRYLDDGTVTQSDSEKYGLRTGVTGRTVALASAPSPKHWHQQVSERDLVGELGSARARIARAIVLVAIGAAAVLLFVLLR